MSTKNVFWAKLENFKNLYFPISLYQIKDMKLCKTLGKIFLGKKYKKKVKRKKDFLFALECSCLRF